jgi:hypothetical protein
MTPASGLTMPDLLGAGPPVSLETVVCSLIELGVEREMIETVPVGIFHSYRGILIGYAPAPGTPIRKGDRVTLYVAERSIADRLPEGFLPDLPAEGHPERVFDSKRGGFIDSDEPPPDGAQRRAYDPYEIACRQLDGGRQLLGLLDRTLRRARRDVAVRHQTLKLTGGGTDLARLLLGLVWLNALDVDDGAAAFASRSLGGFQEAVGTLDEAAAFLGRLFDVPIRASEVPSSPSPIPPALRIRLGRANSRLGRDACPGARVADGRPAVVFDVGPMTSEQAAERHLDVEGTGRVEAAAAALVPAGRAFQVRYDVHLHDRRTRLGRAAHGLLGRTTYLQSEARGHSLEDASSVAEATGVI